jgi:hypothetical protein
VEFEFLEREPKSHHHPFRDVTIPGLFLIDPVAEIGALKRAPLYRIQVDFSAENAADKYPETATNAGLPLTVPGVTSKCKRAPIRHRIRGTLGSTGLPFGQPLEVSPSNLLP